MMHVLEDKKSIISKVEDFCKIDFDVSLRVKDVLLYEVPTSYSSQTTIFKTDRNTVYALCQSDEPMSLSDVNNLIKSMGMEADEFLPPNGDKNYFLRFGYRLFLSVFPSRKPTTAKDLAYYKTLTPYSPALVKIRKINGEIRQYDKIWQKWQKALDFSYLRTRVR